MYQMKTSFDNVGGVVRVVAIPLIDFGRVHMSKLYNSASLILRSTENCIDIETNRSERFSYKLTQTDDGMAYNHTFSGSIFSLDSNRQVLLDKLSRGQWLLFVRTSNDKQFLLGTDDVPLTFEFSDDSGEYGKSRSKIDYTFQAFESEPAIMLDNSPL